MLNKETPYGTVGIMYMDCVRGKFVKSIVDMLTYSQRKLASENKYLHVTTAGCSYHQLARNNLVDTMLGDFIFMTDSDHMFAPDLLTRLIDLSYKYGAKVISGIYQTKFPPHNPVACVWTSDGNKAYPIQDWNREKEVLQIDGAVGGGCLLIYKEVFDRIREELHEQPFTEYNGLSEDYSFCHRCKRLGIPIYLAPRVESHHLVDHALSIEDYIPPPKETLRGI